MKRTTFILGMTLLLSAGAVVLYSLGSAEDAAERPGRESGANDARDDSLPPAQARVPVLAPGPSGRRPSTKSTRPRPEPDDPLASTGVAPGNPNDQDQIRRAQAVETIARRQLSRLREDLDLRHDQQRAIFPLLARATPQYVESLRIFPESPGGTTPLSRELAHYEISRLLDPDQQIDLEIAAAETSAWWSDVIASLEQDLVDATNTPATAAAATAPESDGDGKEEASPAPARHQEGNLFERLNEERP